MTSKHVAIVVADAIQVIHHLCVSVTLTSSTSDDVMRHVKAIDGEVYQCAQLGPT